LRTFSFPFPSEVVLCANSLEALLLFAHSVGPGTAKSEAEHRHDICLVGQWLCDRGFVPSTDGNISLRLDAQHILTTPTCVNKGRMNSDDLVVTGLDGKKVGAGPDPSSELGMHLLIYRCRPDVCAVCHAHPPVATGFAASGISLNKAILCEAVLSLGAVPVAPYAMPGTPALSAALEPFVHGHDAILMGNHGVVAYGPDLLTAFHHVEAVEQIARVTLVTEILGKQNLLSSSEAAELLARRARAGVGPPATGNSQPLITSDSNETERVALTRQELDALIDDALRKDRSRR
jgi:L-fuculose-phosphate aldolase